MESFVINAKIDDQQVDLLVIPDDCNSHSVFHLVKNEMERTKLKYTEARQWEILEGDSLPEDELKDIVQKIEQHFF